jgi:hypothetical protein
VGEEADLLYEAIVQPDRSNLEKKQRVDQAINESLGKLSRQFTRGTVSGYMGRAVPVKRFYENNQSLLILDGVNLASQDAEKEADALVSRLQRIYAARGGQERRSVTACVGYLTSPGGLNGEAALVEWIRERGKAETFDLIRQKEEFAGTVESALSDFSLSSEE